MDYISSEGKLSLKKEKIREKKLGEEEEVEEGGSFVARGDKKLEQFKE